MPHLKEVYRRGRLFRTLDAAIRKRVVWIGAPAGAGKTSVVSTYLAARSRSSLWYNIDARDADVANLFHYLAMAAGIAAPRRRGALPVFAAENQGGIAAFARGFFEALGERLPDPSAIVIDDYHEARSDLVDEVIREALAALPSGVTAIIISRTDAPAWLARHIASGDVALIGWQDLRLTPTEIAALVRIYRPDLRGRSLRDVLPHILELTSGWAAALTLLLQSRSIAHIDAGGVEEFSQRLFDYFATEILDKATPPQRDFLLRTSVVPSFTAELAARLSGAHDAHGILSDLERRSFLTQRLGTSGAYRYHPLLRSFLQRRAQTEVGPRALQDLHRRAADALVEAGQIDEAMEQFETSQDVDIRARLLCEVASSYIAKGRGRTIETWIGKLPPELVARHGWLLFWNAVCCLAYAPTRSRELLEQAHAIFLGENDAAGLYGSCAAAMQAVVHEATNFRYCDPWIQRFDDLRRSGPPCPLPLRPAEATAMVMASVFRGNPALGDEWAPRAMTLAAQSKDVGHRVVTGGFLALRCTLNGSLEKAEVILEMLRDSARASQSSALATLTLLTTDSMFVWARGDNAACIELAREAHAVAARSGVFVWNDYIYGLGAGAAIGSENAEAAEELLTLMRSSAEHGSPFAVGSYGFYASWDAFLRGDVERALRLALLSAERQEALGFPLPGSLTHFALAQIYWRMGNKEEGRAALALARQHATQAGYAVVLLGCDLLESDLEWDEDRSHALVCLRRGLATARHGGYHNAFWLDRATMARVAARALEHGIETKHVRTTIARHRFAAPREAIVVDGWVWRYRLRALGSFEMTRADPTARVAKPTSFPGKSGHDGPRGMPLRLLQAILAFGARGVREVTLIDALWPDAEGDAGRRVFDTTLHRLRRQLGDDELVRLHEGRVFLDERICWVDVWALELALEKAEWEMEKGAEAGVLTGHAGRLLTMYRGPLLVDEPGIWARMPRRRLATRFRRAAMRLANALEQAGQHDVAKALRQRSREEPESTEPRSDLIVS